MSPFSLLFSAALFTASFATPQVTVSIPSVSVPSVSLPTSAPSVVPECIIKCGQLINLNEQEMAAISQNGTTCETLQQNQDNTTKYVNCLRTTCDMATLTMVEGTLASCGVEINATASATASSQSATPTTDSQKKQSSASSLHLPLVLAVGMFGLFMI